MIISIEGPDFVGKNTLVKSVIESASNSKLFKKKEFLVIQFPNQDTEIGKFLRKKLLDKNWNFQDGVIFQLLNTAHRYEYYDDIKRAKTEENFILFIIRYNLSGPVYASIDGLDATKVWNLYSWFDDMLPDITFIVNRNFDYESLAKERLVDHYESKTKQQQVKEIYSLAETLWGNRLGKVININNMEIEETVQSMFDHLQYYIKNGT